MDHYQQSWQHFLIRIFFAEAVNQFSEELTDYRCKDTDIPPRIPAVLRSHQEIKNFLHCEPAFQQMRI